MVCTTGMAPPGIKITTHMLSSVDTPLLRKSTLDQFWDLKSTGITEPLSTSDDDQALTKQLNFLTIIICDQIWENVHSSHIRFCTFRDS